VVKRWPSNAETAGWEEDFSAQIIIKKTSPEYAREKDVPRFPSAAVDDRLIARNDIVPHEDLGAAIMSE